MEPKKEQRQPHKIHYIPPEKDRGCCEYKLKLVYEDLDLRARKVSHIATQMNYRLYQGNGKAIFIIGVSDDGDVEGITEKELEISLVFMDEVAEMLGATIYKKRTYQGNSGYIATLRISKEMDDDNPEEELQFL
jgi:elongation factor 1-alpha